MSWTWRLATPASETGAILAVVPPGSGACLVRDREGDERRLLGAERDLLDRSDRRPGDGHLLAADELARVLEFRGDRVLVTAGQEDDRDRKRRDDQSADRGGPPYGTNPAIPSAGR